MTKIKIKLLDKTLAEIINERLSVRAGKYGTEVWFDRRDALVYLCQLEDFEETLIFNLLGVDKGTMVGARWRNNDDY